MNAFPSYGPLKESACPQCGYKLTGATLAHGNKPQAPEENDVSVCANCGQLQIYQADSTLRKATAQEIRGIMEDVEAWATIEKAQNFIRQRGRFR